ncbi:MAG: hypothetical protein WBO10_14720 [Pyrinomonadaceae bacterium]
MNKTIILAISALVITLSANIAFAQPPRPSSNVAPPRSLSVLEQKYMGLWDGDAEANGTKTPIAYNFGQLADGSIAGEILIKSTKASGRFSSVKVNPDGSITFALTMGDGSVMTHTGNLFSSDQNIKGTTLHVLGAQSAAGTFNVWKRKIAAPSGPQMTAADIANANAAADKAESKLASAQKSPIPLEGFSMFGVTLSPIESKYYLAFSEAVDCVKKFPRFARCYEIRGRVSAAQDKDDFPKPGEITSAGLRPAFKMAIDDLTKAISLDPSSANLYYVRGKIYLEAWQSKPDLAAADAEAALKIDPNNTLAKTLLADAKKKLSPK